MYRLGVKSKMHMYVQSNESHDWSNDRVLQNPMLAIRYDLPAKTQAHYVVRFISSNTHNVTRAYNVLTKWL